MTLNICILLTVANNKRLLGAKTETVKTFNIKGFHDFFNYSHSKIN